MARSESKAATGGNGAWRPFSVLQGVGLTFVFTLASALVLGLAVAWTKTWDVSDGSLKAINLAAIVLGGAYAGRRAASRGWLHGGLVGLVYIVLVSWMMAPEIGFSQMVSRPWLTEALYAVVAGILGGVVGVSIRPGERS